MNVVFKKYIISIDYGSSVIKYLIMDTSKDEIRIVNMDIKKDVDIHDVIDTLINEYSIKYDDIEAVLITGARSSFVDCNSYKFNVIKVEEFIASSYGALLLTKSDKALVINLGTGTTFIYSDLNETKHLGGTALGGGSIMSLAKLLYSINDYNDLISFIKKGDCNNVDLNIGDISKNDIGSLKSNITASNLGAIINNTKKYNDNDVMAGIVNMVVQNIGLLAKEIRNNLILVKDDNSINCILIGGLIKDKHILQYFKNIGEYINIEFITPDYSSHVACIGAYEYYLLKLKNGFIYK